MSLFNKPLEDVVLADIQELIDNGVGESRTLDYKRDMYSNSDSDKRDFLVDVSALANTVGGYLIIGMDEEEGVAKTIQGIEIDDFDKLKLQYEDMLRMSVDPPIRGVEFHGVDTDDSKTILVIKVPRSISRPHAVTYKRHFRFYARHSSGNYPYEVSDIRQAMLATETTAMKIRNFRNDRIAEIASNQTYLPLSDGAKILLHLIPFNSLEVGFKYNWTKRNYEDFSPFFQILDVPGCRLNYDGLLMYHPRETQPIFTHTLAFRNGIVEGTDCSTLEEQGKKKFSSQAFEIRIVQALDRYLASYKKLGIDFPVWVCLSLIGVKGYAIHISQPFPFSGNQGKPIERGELVLPEIPIENPDIPGEDILKPAFDLIWNACGFECSENYHANGSWKLDKSE